jgi:hypothetical protein
VSSFGLFLKTSGFSSYQNISLFVAVIVNNLQHSRELKELKNLKREKKHKKSLQDEDKAASRGSLNESQKSGSDLGNLFDEQHGIDHYYPSYLSVKLKELISSYFMNLATLDHSMSSYRKQQKILDDLVVLAQKHEDKDLD